MKRNICFVVILILILCLCLCACGSSAGEKAVDAAAADADTSVSADDTVAKADELIAQGKYEEAMDVLTSDPLYKDSKTVDDIRDRINAIEKLSNGDTKPATDDSRSTKEITLTKENFWDYFEIKQLYVKDPFNKPYFYGDVIVLKEEYADKIAYNQDFEFTVSYFRYNSFDNVYEIDPDTLEMTFLKTKFYGYYNKDRGFRTYTNSNFKYARLLDYSVFGGSPVEYKTYLDNTIGSYGYLSSGYVYHNYDEDDNVYYVSCWDEDIEDVTGSIILYQ